MILLSKHFDSNQKAAATVRRNTNVREACRTPVRDGDRPQTVTNFSLAQQSMKVKAVGYLQQRNVVLQPVSKTMGRYTRAGTLGEKIENRVVDFKGFCEGGMEPPPLHQVFIR